MNSGLRDPIDQCATGNCPDSVLAAVLANPNGPGICFGEGKHGPACSPSRVQLLDGASRIAHYLSSRGVGRGANVILAMQTSPGFVEALLGVWMVGAAAVPVAPHEEGRRPEASLQRLRGVVQTINADAIVGDQSALGTFADLGDSDRRCALVDIEVARATTRSLQRIDHDASFVAHLQLTSGTTGRPRAAMHDHARLMANIDAIGMRIGVRREDRFVSWIPLHHDMGFVGGLCWQLRFEVPLLLIPTETFVARPATWLDGMSEFEGTLTANPSFAYQLLGGVLGRRKRSGLDLSKWRYGWMGAEPVYHSVISQFERAYHENGLAKNAVRPCYGLAEATLAVSMPEPGTPTRIEWVDQRALRELGIAEPEAEGRVRAVPIVGCGTPLHNTRVEVRDGGETALPDRRVGRIWVRSPSVMVGYFGRPESDQPIVNGWLDTGDLGFTVGTELFITGRIKDLIIRGGVNIHPHEIESAAESVTGVRPGRVAAFSVVRHASSREEIICIAESRAADEAERQRIVTDIRRVAVEVACVSLDHVELVPPGSIPKTTSGKTQRGKCKDMFDRNEFVKAAVADGGVPKP